MHITGKLILIGSKLNIRQPESLLEIPKQKIHKVLQGS